MIDPAYPARLRIMEESLNELVDEFDRRCEQHRALREAVRPILAAYRSEEAHITEEQITRAWEAFDA